MTAKKFKYVITDNLFVRIGSEADAHKAIAIAMTGKPTSAGFAQLEISHQFGPGIQFKVVCFGESIGLGLKSNPENDEKILHKLFVSE